MEKTNNFVKYFILFIILLTIYLLWFYNWQKDNFLPLNTQNQSYSWDLGLDLSLVKEVYDEIKKEYYDIESVKKEDITSWLVSWMVQSLWDRHSEYMTKKEKDSFEETLAWDFEWIWAVVEKLDNVWVRVSMVVKDSPAKKSGILINDIITKADWNELKDLNLYDAVNLIKWKAWTKVKLSIIRETELDIIEKEITREKVVVPTVQTEFFEEEKIWYIALNLFWDNASEEVKDALNEMKEKNVDWIIIDLRDNWWWYLESSVEILSNFIEKWKILVKTRYRDWLLDDVYYSSNTWGIFDKKIVVLVNWNSASASEITAGALKEYKKAVLVWEKTFWKWSVQKPVDLSNGWLLKLTIAKWFTPDWVNIDKDWINPDIEISFIEEDYEKQYDRQLEEAKKVLKIFIDNSTPQIAVDKYKESIKDEN